jgi:hypothetical protein
MSATTPRPGVHRRGGLVAVTAAVVGLLAPLAAVADDATQRLEVEGRVVYRIADPASHEEGAHFEEGSVTTAFAEVDGGAMIDLSSVQAPSVGTESAPADGLPAGAEVRVTVEVPAGLDESEAVALVTGTEEEGAAAGPTRVVDAVATGPAPAAPAAPTAAALAGAHQLVVVPVRWTTSGTVPTAELQTAASGSEEYWERQSGARVDIQVSVRPALTVARPATCDVDRIMDQVVGQTGLVPTGTRHVAVWFPEHTGCDFAGLATIDGGAIWLNGAAHAYVLAHELGHNFGLGHANVLDCTSPGGTRTPLSADGECRWAEYGDNTDVMGMGRNLSSPGNLSSGFAQRLGWANVYAVNSPVVAPTSVTLTPLSQTAGIRGLSFQSEMGTVFTDYRPAVGADALHEPGWAGVQARLLVTDPVYGYPTSYLLDLQPNRAPFANPSLPVGQTWDVAGADATVTTTSADATARLTINPSARAAETARYVTRVYQDLFDREPDAPGLQSWTRKLLNGTARSAVAASITASNEYRSGMIADAYDTYLGRQPDSAGAASWLQAMRTGSTIQTVESRILASSEYYARSGRTDAGWVSALYQNVLGRDAQSSEVATWSARLAGGASRQNVASRFLLSTEHLTSVVDGYYVDLLGRHLDATGQRTWVTSIQGGTRVEAIIGRIIASKEYYGKA